jgi:F0F1-type ATP synthase assembly protein I
MPDNQPDPRELGHYYALAQVGLEMVVPVGVGALLENYFPAWRPWGIVVGAVLGLTTGLAHLVAIMNRWEKKRSQRPRRDNP